MMKNDLTCGVVRDLLPSFVEGLTGPETDAAVEAHLAACPACARLRWDMAAPEGEQAETAKEVDYLKAVRRKNTRRVAAARSGSMAVRAVWSSCSRAVVAATSRAAMSRSTAARSTCKA